MPRTYPPHPVPAVGVVVWKDDAVLLVRRAKPPRMGEWSLPGGAQEVGETTREAAVREVREETGCGVDIAGVVDVIDSVHRDADGAVEYHYTLIDFAARWRDGTPSAGDDVSEAAWFPREDLPGLGLWDETVRVIEASRALVGGGA